jgi:hypothetical protein
VTKNRKSDDTHKETEIIDRLDLVNKNLASFRQDIDVIVRNAVSQVLKERERPKKYVEVGYR